MKVMFKKACLSTVSMVTLTHTKTREDTTMKNNAYFEELSRIARDFDLRHDAHKALKQEIIDTKGWDSDELKAWYAEEERDFQYPISSGA